MLDTLLLPKRYENLKNEAIARQADLTQIVRKVPEATRRVETLLRQVESSRMGRFELMLGLSGSGKTTFLSTLPRFYTGAYVSPLLDTLSLDDVVDEIQRQMSAPVKGQVFVLTDRDNPSVSDAELRTFFERVRRLFRTPEGCALVLWPITDHAAAERIARIAWEIGSDSIVDSSSRGIFRFEGLPKSDYYTVADITARSLNSGQGLEAFGLGTAIAAPLLQKSDTLSQFFGHLEQKSQELNTQFGDTLKERRVPGVWILVAGDDTRELSLTVANLTQGTAKQIDIDRMLAVLDSDDSTSGYLGEWRTRRNQIAFLLRHLDVRLFELTPNVTVSAVRAFGDQVLRDKLKKQKDAAPNAVRAIESARFFQLLIGAAGSTAATIRPASDETANEYRRIQAMAAKNDKLLNKALAECLTRALQQAGVGGTVTAERRSLDKDSGLKPDLMVDLVDGSLICLEPTWRTTGDGIKGEIPSQQSTMTVGHIQQYLLAKVLDYAKDLGL